jgi:hypothetical protein
MMRNQTPAAGSTKLVEIRLAALVRVEHTEVVEVPANITEEELQQLVNDRYNKVDGGEYVDDADYWERGHCYATDAHAGGEPSLMAIRVEGGMHVERAEVRGMIPVEVPSAGD